MNHASSAAVRFLVAFLFATGCATAPAPCPEGACAEDPVTTLTRYRDALVEGRPREAFALIHPDAREGLDEAQFEILYARHADRLIAQAEALLLQANAAPPVMRATVDTDRGPIILELTEDGWKVREIGDGKGAP
jgi:hypothetical protein